MQINCQYFYTQKLGNSPQEYEDALAVNKDNYHFAIADGAAEADFAKEWVRGLTEGFVANPSCLDRPGKGRSRKQLVASWLKPLQDAWYASIDWSALPWYTRLKRQQQGGAYSYATFLGLEMRNDSVPDSKSCWKAIAIGDCVLFQVRNKELIKSFPIVLSCQFDNTPALFYSDPVKNEDSLKYIQQSGGTWLKGDVFFLCSDALAKYCLIQVEAVKEPWTRLSGLNSPQEFEQFINALRQEKAIRNDDATVIIIRTE